MNQPKQFFSLLVFQATLNPVVWFMLFAFASPTLLFIHPFLKSYHENLQSLLNVPNLFFMGILGLWILSPEMAQSRWTNTASSLWTSEFLLTRAVDRSILYRSRAVLFLLIAVVTPVITLALALRSPDLTVIEYGKQARLACLHEVTGSFLRPDPSGSTSPLLVIPHGNILVNEWHLWMFLASALLVQVTFCCLFPLKRRTAIFYTLVLTVGFIPLILILGRGTHDVFPLTERLFLYFAGHQVIFCMTSALIFILGQLWCEQRFKRQEY